MGVVVGTHLLTGVVGVRKCAVHPESAMPKHDGMKGIGSEGGPIGTNLETTEVFRLVIVSILASIGFPPPHEASGGGAGARCKAMRVEPPCMLKRVASSTCPVARDLQVQLV